jgi:hypothetical protein
LAEAFIRKNASLQPGHGYAKSEVMPTDHTPPKPSAKNAGQQQTGKRPLTPAAERALAEAAARRAESAAQERGSSHEVSGRGSLDPTRYGDWEINGLASDF